MITIAKNLLKKINPNNKKILKRYIAFMMFFPLVMGLFFEGHLGLATFLYVVVMFGVPGYYLYRYFTRLKREGVSAVATITGYVESKNIDEYDNPKVSYYPCFEFSAQGKTYNIQSGEEYSIQKYKTGDKVDIRYLPDNPQRAVIDDKSAGKIEPFWLAYIWILLGGIVVLIFFGMVFPESMYLLSGTGWIYGGAAVGMPIGYFFWGLFRLRLLGKSATATVTGYTRHVDSDNGNLSYFPNFEFDVRGRICTLKSSVAYGSLQYNIGDRVNIHYNPDDPESADIDDNFMLGLMFILTCICFLAIVVGVLYFVFQADSFGEIFSKVSDVFF